MKRALALAAIVVAGMVTYGSLGGLLKAPSVFADELIYMDATRSVADGHRPMERDQTYGRGLVFPVVAAPVVALAPNQLDAYRALQWFNAFVFSLAAIPAFFLARRLLSEGWSLAVAGLTAAVPSAVYAGMILTEAAAYATGTLALLALLRVIERPTARRQIEALAAVALAALARPQLVALGAALPVGLALRWWLMPASIRPSLSAALRRLWPTAAAVGFVVVAGAAALASGHASLRDYRDVFTTYDVVDVARWSWYTLGCLGLYVAIVPLVAAPAALADLWRRGRAGSVQDASFLGLFLTVNVVTILIVAAFSSATFGGERLHDRYLFYIVPLWLVLFALWLVRGAPASRRSLALGCALTGALLATIPQNLLLRDTNLQFDAVATAVWSRIRAVDPARPSVLRLLLVIAVLAALGAIVGARRGSPGLRSVLLVPIAVVFILNAVFVWESRAHDADLHVFADDRPATWSWVDRAVPDDVQVTDVFVESGRCRPVNIGAFRMTEFFNATIAPVLRVGVPADITTDGRSVRIGGNGIVRTLDGKEITAEYAVLPPGVALDGHVIAQGTLANLRLWKVGGTLRFPFAKSNAAAVASACPRGTT
ncbi:MAG: hypothetical protein H0W90_03980 [Actinobacteria bacterium]|nr:hypothetical protein [Actinomycetota bacterium]